MVKVNSKNEISLSLFQYLSLLTLGFSGGGYPVATVQVWLRADWVLRRGGDRMEFYWFGFNWKFSLATTSFLRVKFRNTQPYFSPYKIYQPIFYFFFTNQFFFLIFRKFYFIFYLCFFCCSIKYLYKLKFGWSLIMCLDPRVRSFKRKKLNRSNLKFLHFTVNMWDTWIWGAKKSNQARVRCMFGIMMDILKLQWFVVILNKLQRWIIMILANLSWYQI